MSETTILRDGDGNYYTFAPEALAAARAADGTYELEAATLEAARVPDDRQGAVDAALGADEVSGFTANPVPGIDIIVKKKPGGHMARFTDLGIRPVRYGDTGDGYLR